jgi:excisionase family DNA binding protein
MKAMQLSSFADLDRLIEEATPAECPMLCGQLERLKAALWLKMTTGTPKSTTNQPDRLLTAEEVAQRLNCSTDFIYRHAKQYPFMLRVGRHIRFSERGLERYIQQRQG